jgi:hypothetical protein
VDQGLISRLGAIDPSDGGRTSRFSLYSEWSYKGDKSLTQANAYLVYYRLHLFSNFSNSRRAITPSNHADIPSGFS